MQSTFNNYFSLCPSGWSSFKGALDCFQCEPGKFSARNGAPNCTKCNIEKREYTEKNEPGAKKCKVCDGTERSIGGVKCEPLGISDTLEIPTMLSLMINGSKKRQLFLEWSYGKDQRPDTSKITEFIISVSKAQDFETFDNKIHYVNNGIGHTLEDGKPKNYTFFMKLKEPAYIEKRYIRVSAVVLEESSSSKTTAILRSNNPVPLGGWNTWDCEHLDKRYLDTTSILPSEWMCRPCPPHASCEGRVTYDQVKSRFGYWRSTNKTHPTLSIFVPCVYPAACLGAPTEEVELYKAAPFANLSISSLPESCNVKDGYLEKCKNNETCRLCQTCMPGYAHTYIGVGQCHKCPPTDGAVALIIGVIFASVAFITLLIYLKLKNVTRQNRRVTTRAIHSTLKRILLTHLQVVTMVASLNVPWPSGFISMVTVFSSASTMSQHMSALSCEMSRDKSPVGREANLLYTQTIMLVFLPPAIIFFLFFYWVIAAPSCSCMRCGRPLRASIRCETLHRKLHAKRKKQQNRPVQLTIEMGTRSTSNSSMSNSSMSNNSTSNNSTSGGETKNNKEKKIGNEKNSMSRDEELSVASDQGKMMSTRDAWVFSVTLICYIMYPTLVRFPFELLQCRNVDGHLYLERDLEELCYEPGSVHHTMLWTVAIPALMLYALGMPLGIFIIMWRARHRLDTNKYRFRLGLLFSGYRSNRWWWELVVSTRKVMIISLASFGFNEDVQVHLVLGLMLILLICHYTFQPFDVSSRQGELLHRVERNSLLALISMLWAGVVFIMAKDHKCITNLCIGVHNFLIVLIILVNIILLIHGGYLYSYFWLKSQHVFEKIEHLHIRERLASTMSFTGRLESHSADVIPKINYQNDSTMHRIEKSKERKRKNQLDEMKEVEKMYTTGQRNSGGGGGGEGGGGPIRTIVKSSLTSMDSYRNQKKLKSKSHKIYADKSQY